MEDTLGGASLCGYGNRISQGLNPCCNGRYSRSNSYRHHQFDEIPVLILVVMEDTLGDYYYLRNRVNNQVLILVVMEDTLGKYKM